jgi:hypothetical protein
LTVALVKVALAALVMAATTLSVEHILMRVIINEGLGAQALRLIVEIGAGLAALAISAKLLKISEFADAVALLRSRFGGPRRAAM